MDSCKASLDMDHLDLQLNSLDIGLFDSRQNVNWNPKNIPETLIVKTPGLDKASMDFQLKANLNLQP